MTEEIQKSLIELIRILAPSHSKLISEKIDELEELFKELFEGERRREYEN